MSIESVLAAITLPLIGKFLVLSIVFWFVWQLYKLNNNPNNSFAFSDLFIDDNGKAGGSRMRINLAFIVATGVLIYFSLNDKLTEWYFSAYMLAFIGDRISSRINTPKDPASK
jgi:hypothetical protein